ncbi:zinc finger protein 135 [Danaus plexippus plexippus]|uniref:Zinc finger protein 135 n=1 Tax=Danaus plexippus plexippus TaxID=278856 RepID=A0A212EZF7_DANPL|nr:zinc finger protein 135 [Danaus plexippus plexippus]
MSLANIEIKPDDGLPDGICESCNDQLNNCIKFIDRCKKSDSILRNVCYNDIPSKSQTTDLNNVCIKLEVSEIDIQEKSSLQNNTSCDKVLSDSNNTNKQQCFTCGKVMSSKFRLKTHLATHATEKAYICSICKKSFSILQNLNVHLRTHTGEKPFSCSTCGKTFAQSSGLTAHKRKHTGLLPYQCVLCPRKFRTFGHLQYHIRQHTGEKKYECDVCSRAFITRSDLKQHVMTHRGDKPHICSICGMRLSRASNLKRHITYLHDKSKTFNCSQCPSKFMNKSELTKHEKKHQELKVPNSN